MDVTCRDCGRSFRHTRAFKLHLNHVHGLTMRAYVTHHEHGGIEPTCACGCGKAVTWRQDAYFLRLIHGHVTQEMRDAQSTRRLGMKATSEQRRKVSSAARAFFATKEGAEVATQRARSLREWVASDEGIQSAQARGARLKLFNETPAGKAIRKRVGLKLKMLRKQHPEKWPVVRLPRIQRTCPICDNEFSVTASSTKRKPDAVCCSRSCAAELKTQPRHVKPCEGCQADMVLTQRNLMTRRFCSVRCARGSLVTRERLSASMADQHVSGKRNVASQNHTCGFFTSTKVDEPTWYRSSYELAYLERLDRDPNVETFLVEPVSITYQFEGRKRRYVPDFIVIDVKGQLTLVEVKPKKLLQLPINVAKLDAAKAWCALNDVELCIVSEDDLFRQTTSS